MEEANDRERPMPDRSLDVWIAVTFASIGFLTGAAIASVVVVALS